MQRKYLGDAKDCFKRDYLHFLVGALTHEHLQIVWMMNPDDPGPGGLRVKTIDGERHILDGNVIVAVGDVSIRSFEDLPRILGQLSPGETVSVRLIRGGSPVTVRVKLTRNPLRS